MEINIRLGRNFTRAYNKMQEKYGEEFAKLNGFADEQLSYTDFIDNFIDTDTVADASVDGNANVGNKDMRTLMNEMPKPHRKLLAYNKIYYELNKKYGFKTANDWLEKTWNYALYLHDADTSTFLPYCYKPEEMLTVTKQPEGKDGDVFSVTFKELYDIIEATEEYDPTISQYVKFPKNWYVLDVINEKEAWTKIKRIVRHNNEKPMRFIKFSNGISQIVTEDHPIITTLGDIPANKATEEDCVYSYKPSYFKNYSSQELNKGFIMNKDLGWITGLALSEGCSTPSSVIITQKEKTQREKLFYLLNKYNIPYRVSDIKIFLKVCPFEKFLEKMLLGKTAAFKSLPIDYNNYPDNFLQGVIAGMIDGDGTIDGYKHRHCQIRIASEQLIHQLSNYLQSKGIFCGDRTPHRYHSETSFAQKLPLFGIGFTLTNEDFFQQIESIKISQKYEPLQRKGNFKNKKYQYSYGVNNIIENSVYIDSCPVVYDITTETGHFLCNNILSHNCFAYDLKDLAEKGLFFLDNFNAQPPQHLATFIDFVKEFISFNSNRTSGACGLPNLIPYFYYFWKKDCESGHQTYSPDYHARQQIQRFVYAINQPYVRDGMQSAFTNVSVFDGPYLEALFGGSKFPDGTYMIDELDNIKEFQKLFMEVVSDIRNQNMMTFPVLTISLLRKNGNFADEEFAKWGIEHNRKWNDSNLFIDKSVTSLSNCCRLKSNIDDLGYFNSIGGTALKVGSVKVSTLNLARLALENETEEEYLLALKELTELNCKALDAVRHIIERNVEKGLLPNFSKGLIDFNHLYSTIGVIGCYETMEKFGYTKTDSFGNTYYTDSAMHFGEQIFKVIHTVKDNFMLDKNYKINLEAIPGESAASKMQQADTLLYPEIVIDTLPLYGNQFIPLGIKTTIQERIRIASTFDSYCNGGSIAHINIEAPFDNFDKAWELTNWIADQGLTYFAFNTKIQACKNNHGFFGKTCPICGEKVETEYTRVVGFYVPINTWSKQRKAEYAMREWENVNGEN